MALSAVECPDGICHSHHGGHAIARDELHRNLIQHGPDWCERVAERIYEISVDTFCQMVMPHLQEQGWQRRHLDWEFKLHEGEAEAERTLVDGAINAMESFLRSSEVQRLFIKELVQGTLAEAEQSDSRRAAVRHLIERELLVDLENRREALVNRLCENSRIGADTDPERARHAAEEAVDEVHHLLVNHAEAMG